MFNFLKVILIVVSPLWAHAQWDIIDQKVIGGNRDASFGKYLKSNEGGYYYYFNSAVQTSGNITVESHGSSFFVFRKYSNSDELVWEKSFGGSNMDNIIDAKEVEDGLVLFIQSTSPIGGMKEVQEYGDNHGWVVKIDYEGNIIWQKSFGGSEANLCMGIVVDDDQNLYFGFRSSSPISGTRTAELKGFFDYWVVKTDELGNVIWDKSFGSEGFDGLLDIDILSDGTVVLLGRSNSDISMDKSEDSYSVFGRDIWVVAINKEGELLWDRTIGGEGDQSISWLLTLDNEIFVAANSSSDISGNREVPRKGVNDIWLIKLDNEGKILLQKSYGGNEQEGIGGIISLDEDHLLLMANSNSNQSIDKSENSRGSFDFWPIIIDKNGNLILERTFGGDKDDFITSGMKLNDKIYLSGNTRSGISGDKTLPLFPKDIDDDFNRDVWIVQLDASTLDIVEQEKNVFTVYPNPVSDIVNIDFLENQNVSHIQVYSSDGKLVLTQITSENGQKAYKLDMSSFPKGLYSLLIHSEKGVSSQKIVKW